MISVCLASYNGSKYIETQIRSILSQLSENDELIISDDGSTDDTISVINSINDRRILIIQNNGTHGYTGNFENALKHTKGDIIVLSDQDDVWVDNKISIICRDLDTADFVTSNAIVVDGDLNIINESLWSMRPPGFSPLADFVQCAYLGCCMAFNRKVLDFALPFPPNHNLCAHDYWLQLVGSFFFKVKYEHTPLIYYRRHGSNVSDAGFSKGLPIYDKIKYRLYTIIWLFLRKYGKNSYSLYDIFRLGVWLIRTKFISPTAKLFCFPIDIRGRKYIDYGKRLSLGTGCRIEIFDNGLSVPTLKFGNNVQINDYVHIVGMNSVTIGDNVLMASHIFISDNSHGSYKGNCEDSDPTIPPIKRKYPTSPISIGDNTWICEGVMIMPGSTIGKGCVIGAHSIVRGNIPDYSIAVGNPARIIKKFNFETKRWERI